MMDHSGFRGTFSDASSSRPASPAHPEAHSHEAESFYLPETTLLPFKTFYSVLCPVDYENKDEVTHLSVNRTEPLILYGLDLAGVNFFAAKEKTKTQGWIPCWVLNYKQDAAHILPPAAEATHISDIEPVLPSHLNLERPIGRPSFREGLHLPSARSMVEKVLLPRLPSADNGIKRMKGLAKQKGNEGMGSIWSIGRTEFTDEAIQQVKSRLAHYKTSLFHHRAPWRVWLSDPVWNLFQFFKSVTVPGGTTQAEFVELLLDLNGRTKEKMSTGIEIALLHNAEHVLDPDPELDPDLSHQQRPNFRSDTARKPRPGHAHQSAGSSDSEQRPAKAVKSESSSSTIARYLEAIDKPTRATMRTQAAELMLDPNIGPIDP
ncbi:hypothetical protein HDU86_000067 [Geranomyces michiganensis]|nr:hypothetical protein HDU86_000067 [Geranomyces michiganensis]